MATKLNMLERDVEALTDGVWIKPDESLDIELLVKARDSAFDDKQSIAWQKLLRRARQEGQLTSKQTLNDLPSSVTQRVTHEILLKDYLLGVKNLEGDEGPISVHKYREMALTERFRPLLDLATEAVFMATIRRASDREEALGNSAPSRPITSDGAASQA